MASFGSFGDSITGPLQSIWDIFLYFFCRFVIHFGLWNHLIYWSKLGILLLSFFFCFGFSYFLISAMFLFASLENPCNAISTPSLQFRSIPIVAPAWEMGCGVNVSNFQSYFRFSLESFLYRSSGIFLGSESSDYIKWGEKARCVSKKRRAQFTKLPHIEFGERLMYIVLPLPAEIHLSWSESMLGPPSNVRSVWNGNHPSNFKSSWRPRKRSYYLMVMT